MGWFFRRSFKILPGVRLNVGRRTSVSIGPPGVKYNIGPGRDRVTVGIPGTGLYHTELVGKSVSSKPPIQYGSSTRRARGNVAWIAAGLLTVVLGLFGVSSLITSSSYPPVNRDTTTQDSIGPRTQQSKQAAQKSPAVYAGSARVVDGDTINVNGYLIRLEGIDAPEADQTCVGASGNKWQCGKSATQHLSGLVKGQTVTCDRTGDDVYGRMLAICKTADGTDINAKLVSDGFALAFVRYSTRYVKEERDAKRAKRGLWVGTFQPPWEWRAGNRADQKLVPQIAATLLPQKNSNYAQNISPTAKATSNCSIKGNINDRGERIYHVPGSKWYSRTQINERNGERWFCSVADAEAAGWRAPRNRN
ncbi:MAG: DUF4236 domain-containing protein [Xanthobacteraceae bacterium]|nr:DUF4236 domain-containing protein [Xanthobacteraceae bacterium]